MSPRAKGCLPLVPLALVLLALGGFVLGGSTTRPRVVRSRLTIVVETPEGERTGSSVTQETTSFPGGLTRAQGWGIWTKFVGEAVVIDLGQRGLLFATLVKPSWLFNSPGWGGSGGYTGGLMPFPPTKFPTKSPSGASENTKYAAYLDELNRQRPKAELPFNELPVLVRFDDPNVSTSAAIVDPQNLASSYGPGVTLKEATVEITGDPITKGIETRLPWLKSSEYTDPLFPNPTHQPPPDKNPARRLSYDCFRMLPR